MRERDVGIECIKIKNLRKKKRKTKKNGLFGNGALWMDGLLTPNWLSGAAVFFEKVSKIHFT